MTLKMFPPLSYFPALYDTFVTCCAYAASANLSAMHSPTSPGVERRQNPRTALQGFFYLNLADRCYGSVLNISKTGLCFRSVVPVSKTGTISFSLSEGHHQVDGTGEVVWTDETQKTGGLRFTELSPAASGELFSNWISPAKPSDAPGGTQPRLPRLVAHSQAKSAPSKLRGALSPLLWVVDAVSRVKVPTRLRTFSSGLVTGVLVSVLVAGILLFNNYRRQFGEFLIQWGQRFTSQTQTQAAVPAVGSAEFSGKRTAQAEPLTTTQPATVEKIKPKPTPPSEEPSGRAEAAIVVRPEQRKVETNSPVLPPSLPVPPAAAPVLSAPTFESLNPLHPANPHDKALLRPEVAPPVAEPANAVSISEMFCDVGSFKDAAEADDTIKRLSDMGFPATTVEKAHLWRNSYHVLVGPYGSTQQFKSARKSLMQRGFQPKPFEKGSRSLTLLSNLTLDGVQVPDGQYIISWGSYLSEATVKFVRNYAVVATAEGKWIKRGNKYRQDTYLYRPNRDGSRTLVEIHFQGMSEALVFGDKE